jgi:hypothetical protein
MTDLSPAAQAVLDAFTEDNFVHDWKHNHYNTEALAAALRTAANQVVPEEQLHGGDQRWQFERDARQHSRKRLLAIADELEIHQ